MHVVLFNPYDKKKYREKVKSVVALIRRNPYPYIAVLTAEFECEKGFWLLRELDVIGVHVFTSMQL